MKISKPTCLNHITSHNLQSYMACWHTKSQSVKDWWRYNTSDMNARQLCMKIPKNCNNIKGLSITWRHTWHVDISKCVLIWHTFCESLVKICANKHKCCSFFDIFFRKKVLEIKNPSTLGTTRILYGLFGKYCKPLHKLTDITVRNPELPTDRPVPVAKPIRAGSELAADSF